MEPSGFGGYNANERTAGFRESVLVFWLMVSAGLAIRDLRLLAGSGGVTPRWLLRVETLAFGMSSLGALASLGSSSQAATAAGGTVLRKCTFVAGFLASVIHGVRLAMYLRSPRRSVR